MGAVYLIRHGQASFAKADYDQLSKLGHRQARRLGEALAPRLERVTAVFSGSMRRHRETAVGCLTLLDETPAPCIDAGLNEFDHHEVIVRYRPAYRNRLLLMADMSKTLSPRRTFQAMFSAACARWVSGAHDHEYRESWSAFRQRCLAALETVIAATGPSRSALVFTSGGPITAICQELLRIPDEHALQLNWTLTNCSVTKIVYGERGRYLSTFNDHGHFEGAWRELISYR